LTAIAACTAATTLGSGAKGFSLLDSLNASAPACFPCL
jgi:hypothetical protein